MFGIHKYAVMSVSLLSLFCQVSLDAQQSGGNSTGTATTNVANDTANTVNNGNNTFPDANTNYSSVNQQSQSPNQAVPAPTAQPSDQIVPAQSGPVPVVVDVAPAPADPIMSDRGPAVISQNIPSPEQSINADINSTNDADSANIVVAPQQQQPDIPAAASVQTGEPSVVLTDVQPNVISSRDQSGMAIMPTENVTTVPTEATSADIVPNAPMETASTETAAPTAPTAPTAPSASTAPTEVAPAVPASAIALTATTPIETPSAENASVTDPTQAETQVPAVMPEAPATDQVSLVTPPETQASEQAQTAVSEAQIPDGSSLIMPEVPTTEQAPAVAPEVPASKTSESEQAPSLDVTVDYDSPSYTQLRPIAGWDRYSGDSAGSVSEWCRWWRYLRMKTPVVMKWMNDFVVRIYPSNEIFRSLFVKGIYDPNSITVVNSLLPKDGIFVDVGATFGLFSIPATKAVGPNGRVIAIEPSSRDYDRLVDNIKINKLENIISTYRLAISDSTGTAELSVATEERSALNTLGKEFSFKGVDKAAKETVDTIAIDDFIVANQIKRVDVLKLDIEGSELKALQGARKTIAKYRPVIMLGVNKNALKASGTDHDEIQKELNELGYKAYKIIEDPIFTLELIPDLTKESAKIVFCFPEDVRPPLFPQPEEKSFFDRIKDFFVK